MVGPVMERLLRDRPREWFGNYDEMLMRCFGEGVELGRKMQGRNPDRWRYGGYLENTFRHPIFGQASWVRYLPTIGQSFRVNIGPVPMSGSATTVKQTTPRLGPSMRFVADVGNWDNSKLNLAFGQSGQLFSGHYSDQWDAYYVGKSFPLPFSKVEGSILELTPRQ